MDTLSPRDNDWNYLLPPTSSGVYKITCSANNMIYVGSSVDLRERKKHHFSALRYNRHDNKAMQNAWNTYGEKCFTFDVIELVLPVGLLEREQYWFNKLKPFGKKGFNIAPEAGSNRGIKRTMGHDLQAPTHIWVTSIRTPRDVSFTCKACGKKTTQSRMPGPQPRYCSDTCKAEGERTRTRARVARLRQRQKEG